MNLKEGAYVRVTYSPHMFGTVHVGTKADGKEGIIFRQDPRLAEKMPDVFILSESEVEECAIPSDAEINSINAVLAANPTIPPFA
jgi:hypothetical protein